MKFFVVEQCKRNGKPYKQARFVTAPPVVLEDDYPDEPVDPHDIGWPDLEEEG